ncbi:MAG TPA: hypothetical protein VNK26_06515 [Pyrinomonadaceae bacterium]|jgi:hypothetical protein|nr:hypothetical protein [Pyrinomonadaceae bacterium]
MAKKPYFEDSLHSKINFSSSAPTKKNLNPISVDYLDKIIYDLASSYENRRARQVSEWEKAQSTACSFKLNLKSL